MATYQNAIFSEKDEDGSYRVGLGQLDAPRRTGMYLGQSVFLKAIETRLHAGTGVEISRPRKSPGMSEDEFITRIFTISASRTIGRLSEFKIDDSPLVSNPEVLVPIATATFKSLPRYVEMIERLHQIGELQFGLRGSGSERLWSQSDTGTVTMVNNLITWDLTTGHSYKLNEIIEQ